MDAIRDELYQPLKLAIAREKKYRNGWTPHAEIYEIGPDFVTFSLRWRDEEQDRITCGFKWLEEGCPGHFRFEDEVDDLQAERAEYERLKKKFEGEYDED
jgi:hypothetical protein